MIAFKTFEQCPEDQRPAGVPLACPWVVSYITEEKAAWHQSHGFQTMSEIEFGAYKDSIASEMAAYEAIVRVPAIITPRQVRLALIAAGKSLESIDAFINSLSEPTKSQARVWWEYSLEFQRSNAIMNALAPQMGLTQTDMDNLFVLGAKL